MEKVMRIIFLISILFNASFIQAQSDSLIAAVSQDSLLLSLKELTGALPFTLNGKVKSIQTRVVKTTGNRLASEYFSQRMEKRGLAVENLYFQGTKTVELNFTRINKTPITYFPLWLCTDWGEIFSMKDEDSEWESRLNSATPEIDGLDWISPQNQNTIIAISKTGNLALTTDAGESWIRKSTGIGSVQHFFISSLGNSIAIGKRDTIWQSTNLGSSWTRTIVDSNANILQGSFLSNNHVLLVGNNNHLLSEGKIFESKDAGVTWSVVQNILSTQLKTVFSTDSLHAWCASLTGEVYYTNDGGDSWTKRIFNLGSSATKIFFYDNSNGWILTSGNKFYGTTDGGNTWNFLSTITAPSTIHDFLFYSYKNGLLIGTEVSKKQTWDGGRQWFDNTRPLLSNVFATIDGTQKPEHYIILTAHSDCEARAPANKYLIAPGADDDASGIAVLLELARIFKKYPVPISLKFAILPDEEIAGDGAKILGTTLLSRPEVCRLALNFDMVGYDYVYPNTVTMGYYGDTVATGLFLKYGNTISTTNIPLTLIGWANTTTSNTGGFRNKNIPLLFLTEGAGKYSLIQPNYHRASDLWSTINPEFISNITRSVAAFIYNISSDLFLGIAEDNNSENIPSSFNLDLPYPNPFNTSTIIRFGMPVDAKVSIIIYNLLGQQITKLIEGDFDKGYHSTSWNAANVNSGIYFARLIISDEFSSIIFSKTSKLLLLK